MEKQKMSSLFETTGNDYKLTMRHCHFIRRISENHQRPIDMSK